MIGLVVTGHGHFADGIHTSAQMIAGENDYVRYINFEEGMLSLIHISEPTRP